MNLKIATEDLDEDIKHLQEKKEGNNNTNALTFEHQDELDDFYQNIYKHLSAEDKQQFMEDLQEGMY